MAAPAQPLARIGILSLGDMGVGIARLLIAKGFSVATNCTGRSQTTIDRAREANVDMLPSDEELARQCDIIFSIVPPRDAVETARRIADALPRSGRRPADRPLFYADMNAVAPATARSIAELFGAAGRPEEQASVRLIDGCILGVPPKLRSDGPANAVNAVNAVNAANAADWCCPPMPTSGACGLDDVHPLLAAALNSRHIGADVGAASGLKMCYSAMTKGYAAVAIQAFTTAQRLGVLGDLQWAMDAAMPPGHRARTEALLTVMPPKAYRWVREMEEMSATFADDGGFGPELFQGAADVFRIVAEDTVLGEEKIGARQRGQTAEDVAVAIAEGLAAKQKGG